MKRMIIQTVIALTVMILGLGGHARAFTLRLDSISDSTSGTSAGEATDLPTPQFFQIAIGRNGVTLGAIRPSEGYTAPQSEIRFQEIQTPQPVAGQEAQRPRNLSTTPRLSGAEILLLRKTQITAAHQSN